MRTSFEFAENKINKYIKGIKNKINIKEIKEKTMLIFVILILNINQEQYFIKSLKNEVLFIIKIINKNI